MVTDNYKKIVVAVDGSKQAEKAFHKAIEVAKLNQQASLTIVHVIDTSSSKMFDLMFQNMYDLVHEHAKVLVDGYELLAKESGVENVETMIVKGTPKSILTKDLSEMTKPDLIICGKRGQGEVQQVFMGTTSEAIVRNATCDVLIVN